ncbi:MAG: MBL fold metallo-hydrolase [Saprospiraceae bacterium]
MKLTFLGTGTSQGIPVIGCDCEVCKSIDDRDKRLRCAALITKDDSTILIDSGPDIRQQLLRTGISALKKVLITHEHYDHTGGLDDLRPLGFKHHQGMDIYAQSYVHDIIKVKFDYAFTVQKYPGAPKFNLFTINPFEEFILDTIRVYPLAIQHGHLNILGFRFDDKLAYITDANGIPESTLHSIYKIDTLVINALHHQAHHSHFTLAKALSEIKKINPRQAYIIHMSHQMGFHQTIEEELPLNVRLAYDTLSIKV